MPILSPRPPVEATEVISRALAPMARQPGTLASRMAASFAVDGSVQFEFAAPHAIFLASLAAVAAGHLLDDVRFNGWRYLLLREGVPVGSATVEQVGAGETFAFSHVSQGPFVNATYEGIARLEVLPDVESDDFELRLLDVPGLGLRSLWLHGVHREILLPLKPAPSPVAGYEPHSEEQLVGFLRGKAASLLESASERLL